MLAPPTAPRTTLPPAPTPAGRRGGYGRAALAREQAAVAGAPSGRCNATLNLAAFNLGQLVADGLLDADEVRVVLLAPPWKPATPRPRPRPRSRRGWPEGRSSPVADGTVPHDR
jgi:hypothetical protein